MIQLQTKSPTYGIERKPSRAWLFGLKLWKGVRVGCFLLHISCYSKLCYFKLRFCSLVLRVQKKQKWTSLVSEFPVEVYLGGKKTSQANKKCKSTNHFSEISLNCIIGRATFQQRPEGVYWFCHSKTNWLKLGLCRARPQIDEGKTQFSFFIFSEHTAFGISLCGLQYVALHFNAFPPPDGLDKNLLVSFVQIVSYKNVYF